VDSVCTRNVFHLNSLVQFKAAAETIAQCCSLFGSSIDSFILRLANVVRDGTKYESGEGSKCADCQCVKVGVTLTAIKKKRFYDIQNLIEGNKNSLSDYNEAFQKLQAREE
jgi:hypothetical protein